mgnify:FL=1
MGKLLTTGCSFVWGDELDGYDNNPPTHWDKTFTYKLADTLGLEPVIIAECGNSNHKIYRDLIDYLTDPENDDPEMIFVSWSAFKRHELFEIKEEDFEERQKIKRFQHMTQYSPERFHWLNKENREITELFINLVWNYETPMMHLLTQMKALQALCDAKGIKIMQTHFHYRMGFAIQEMHKHQLNDPTYYGKFSTYVKKTIMEHLRWENSLGFRVWEGCDELSRDHTDAQQKDWHDMYYLSRNTEGCKVLEFMHPCENTHTAYADQIADITKKLGWKFS